MLGLVRLGWIMLDQVILGWVSLGGLC